MEGVANGSEALEIAKVLGKLRYLKTEWHVIGAGEWFLRTSKTRSLVLVVVLVFFSLERDGMKSGEEESNN